MFRPGSFTSCLPVSLPPHRFRVTSPVTTATTVASVAATVAAAAAVAVAAAVTGTAD